MWGIIPAAGAGSRIQPLAFSKELLPVGSRRDGETERPRAASGTPIISDYWEGLDEFFEPGAEILLARAAADVVDALSLSGAELKKISHAARERTLAQHTADQRAVDFENVE